MTTAPDTLVPFFTVGDVVDVVTRPGQPPKRYKVLKVNRTRFRAQDTSGKPWDVPLEMVVQVSADQEWQAPDLADQLVLGAVVQFKVPPRSAGADDLFVVVKVGTNGVNVASLGGDGGRYYRSVQEAHLDKVDISSRLG